MHLIWFMFCDYHNIDQSNAIGHNYKVNTDQLIKSVGTLFLPIDDTDCGSKLVDSSLTWQPRKFILNEILTERSIGIALCFQIIKLLLRFPFPHYFHIIPKLNSISLSLKNTNPNLQLAYYPNLISKLILYNLIIYVHYV